MFATHTPPYEMDELLQEKQQGFHTVPTHCVGRTSPPTGHVVLGCVDQAGMVHASCPGLFLTNIEAIIGRGTSVPAPASQTPKLSFSSRPVEPTVSKPSDL